MTSTRWSREPALLTARSASPRWGCCPRSRALGTPAMVSLWRVAPNWTESCRRCSPMLHSPVGPRSFGAHPSSRAFGCGPVGEYQIGAPGVKGDRSGPGRWASPRLSIEPSGLLVRSWPPAVMASIEMANEPRELELPIGSLGDAVTKLRQFFSLGVAVILWSIDVGRVPQRSQCPLRSIRHCLRAERTRGKFGEVSLRVFCCACIGAPFGLRPRVATLRHSFRNRPQSDDQAASKAADERPPLIAGLPDADSDLVVVGRTAAQSDPICMSP